MAIQIRTSENRCEITIDEALTIFQMADFHKQLLAQSESVKTASLELAGEVELDTAGIQMLIALKKQLQQAGGDLSLIWSAESTGKALHAFNLVTHFNSEQEKG